MSWLISGSLVVLLLKAKVVVEILQLSAKGKAIQKRLNIRNPNDF
jgi:hypothetical protein